MNPPTLIENDPRIGKQMRHKTVGDGFILRIHRFEDGVENFTVDLGDGHQYSDDAQTFRKMPYEQGLEQGGWDIQAVKDAGFTSAAACLEHQEQRYTEAMEEEVPSLHKKDPQYAKDHAEFCKGRVDAARRDLKGMEL